LLLSSACGLCTNEEIARFPSPDGMLEAVLFERNCGASTDFSTQVTIVRAGFSMTNQAGDAFVADANHGSAKRAWWGGPAVELRWLDSNTLLIRYDEAARVIASPKAVVVSTVPRSWTIVKLVFEAGQQIKSPK